jgi:hypothetical protein
MIRIQCAGNRFLLSPVGLAENHLRPLVGSTLRSDPNPAIPPDTLYYSVPAKHIRICLILTLTWRNCAWPLSWDCCWPDASARVRPIGPPLPAAESPLKGARTSKDAPPSAAPGITGMGPSARMDAGFRKPLTRSPRYGAICSIRDRIGRPVMALWRNQPEILRYATT